MSHQGGSADTEPYGSVYDRASRFATGPGPVSYSSNVERGEGHIVAMGGGGFSMEPENPLLDDFVLGLSQRQPARVCFVPTASADAATYIVRFYRAFAGRCIASDLTLWNPPSLPRQPARTSEI